MVRKRQAWAILIVIGIVCVMANFRSIVGYATPIGQTSAGQNATENLTNVVEDFMPSIMLLVFVMVFMLILLTLVDRIGYGGYTDVEEAQSYRGDIVQREAQKPPKPKWETPCIQCGAPMWGKQTCSYCGLEYDLK